MNYTGLYLGCHFVNKSEAGLLSSGLAGYTEIDERVCIRTCSKLGYSYAVIQSGLLCFCTNDFSSNATANQTDCVLPFFSGKWYFNELAMRFYRVPTENLKVEKVSISHHRRRIGAGFNITASVNIKDMALARLTVDPGDGNELVFCDSPMTHFYKNPGIYRIFLMVEDIKGNKFNFTDSIEIADNLTKLDVECPRAVPQGHTAECNIKLARALNVTGKLSVESKEITLQQIPG